jgi:hypothetical protein
MQIVARIHSVPGNTEFNVSGLAEDTVQLKQVRDPTKLALSSFFGLVHAKRKEALLCVLSLLCMCHARVSAALLLTHAEEHATSAGRLVGAASASGQSVQQQRDTTPSFSRVCAPTGRRTDTGTERHDCASRRSPLWQMGDTPRPKTRACRPCLAGIQRGAGLYSRSWRISFRRSAHSTLPTAAQPCSCRALSRGGVQGFRKRGKQRSRTHLNDSRHAIRARAAGWMRKPSVSSFLLRLSTS